MAVDEKRIAHLMKTLGISREEALDLEGYDASLKDGVKAEYDLTPEQQKNVSDMMRKTEHKRSAVKRERKPNELKEGIVAEIADFLREDAQNHVFECVEIINPNRMIAFVVDGKRFELTLIEKRATKK